ncbi:MAG: RrF2 family transcriptional regulator [Desulfurivibrionaceae bacterium]
MRLTTRSRYGTRLILDIAQHQDQGPVQVGDIAKREELSVKYLELLIRSLRQAGFLKSVRGAKGGHLLTKPPEEIRIGEIVKVLEGDTVIVDCSKDNEHCSRKDRCSTLPLWQEIEQLVNDKLYSVTVRDLMDRESGLSASRD